MKIWIQKHFIWILMIIVGSAISLSAMFRPGMMQTHDGLWHVQRATEMAKMLNLGYFPVRWAFNLDNQYGVPLFNFVYPGPYYLTAPFLALGTGSVLAIKIITYIFYAAGGVGIYLLFARKSRTLATLAGLLYLLTPYQLVNIFVRAAIGETMVIAMAPWVLYILSRLKHRPIRWYDPLPLFIALIAHNFLGLIITVLALIYSSVAGYGKRVFVSIALSLGLAAFFIVPAIAERGLTFSNATGDYSFVWSDHFIYPMQLLYSRWDYWYSMPGVALDGMTFQLGFANIAVMVGYLLWYLLTFPKQTKSKRLLYGSWIVAALLTLLAMIPQGRWIWETFSFLQVMQFPWRLLGVMTIITGIMTGILLTQKDIHKPKLVAVGACLLLTLALVNTRNYHTPIKTLSPEEFETLHAVYIDKTTTSMRSEIVPKWAGVERWKSTHAHMVSEALGLYTGGGKIEVTSEKQGDLRFDALAENDQTQAIYYRNYFPSWRATKDGEPVELMPSEKGEILIPLSAGKHAYRIFLDSTNVEKGANLISLLTLGSLLYATLMRKK